MKEWAFWSTLFLSVYYVIVTQYITFYQEVQGIILFLHDIRMNCFPSSFSKYLVFKNLIPVPKTLLGSY